MRVSGHANPNDLQLMLNLMRPTYFIPVQGEYRELAAHADLAHAVGSLTKTFTSQDVVMCWNIKING